MSIIVDLHALQKRSCHTFYGANLFDGFGATIFPDDSSIDEAALIDFLSVTNNIVQSHGLQSQDVDPILGDGKNISHVDSGAQNNIDESVSMMWYSWGHNDGNEMPYGVGSLSDINMAITSLAQRPWPPEELIPMPDNEFTPHTIVSIPVSAQNVDAGKELIQILLEEQDTPVMQGGEHPGFFVKKSVYGNVLASNPLYSNDEPLAFQWESFIEKLSVPNNVDIWLRDLLYQESIKMYTGLQSVEDTAKTVINQSSLYYNERN